MPFLSGFPGVFLFSRVDCPPRRAAADVRPPAAPVHKKRRRPPSTPSRSMNVRMCGPFPPEICPFPLKNGGFPTLPPVLPVYPGFSIILSPYSRAAKGPARGRATPVNTEIRPIHGALRPETPGEDGKAQAHRRRNLPGRRQIPSSPGAALSRRPKLSDM